MKRLLPILFILTLWSCNSTDQHEKDIQIIQNYLSDHQITDAIQDESGVFIRHIFTGDGLYPDLEDSITVKYSGYLSNDVFFDKTTGDETRTFALSGLVEGWQIGLPLMREGGKAQLFIPSDLGYGDVQQGIIPANSVLIFEIELIDVY